MPICKNKSCQRKYEKCEIGSNKDYCQDCNPGFNYNKANIKLTQKEIEAQKRADASGNASSWKPGQPIPENASEDTKKFIRQFV